MTTVMALLIMHAVTRKHREYDNMMLDHIGLIINNTVSVIIKDVMFMIRQFRDFVSDITHSRTLTVWLSIV